jgi:hypothetical protein
MTKNGFLSAGSKQAKSLNLIQTYTTDWPDLEKTKRNFLPSILSFFNIFNKIFSEEDMRKIFLTLCLFFVTYLIGLGVLRFYRSTFNRIRQYQLEYLKHYSIVNDDLFNRLIKSKRKSELQTLNSNKSTTSIKTKRSFINSYQSNTNTDYEFELENYEAFESDRTEDSSVTILSLRSSSLEDYRSIIKGKEVKVRVMYDLESIVRESIHESKHSNHHERKKHRRHSHHHHSQHKCNNPRCRKSLKSNKIGDEKESVKVRKTKSEQCVSYNHKKKRHRKKRSSDESIIIEGSKKSNGIIVENLSEIRQAVRNSLIEISSPF